jgi:hypothetical protein
MIIDFENGDDDEYEEQFDTDDMAGEPPDRVEKALLRLVEEYATSGHQLDALIKALHDAGLTAQLGGEWTVVVSRRDGGEKARAWFRQELDDLAYETLCVERLVRR